MMKEDTIMQEFKETPHVNRTYVSKSYFERVKSTLKEGEGIEYLTYANMGGNVVFAVTNKRIILRPAPGLLKSNDKRAIADISFNDIEVLRKTGLRGNTIEIKANETNYDSINDVDDMKDYIIKKAGLSKVIFCPDCKEPNIFTAKICSKCGKSLSDKSGAKTIAKRGVGIAGAIGGGIAGIIGLIVGFILMLFGILLCLTIIGAIIGIPLIIVSFMIMGGGLIFGMGGAWFGKKASRAGDIEWRKMKK